MNYQRIKSPFRTKHLSFAALCTLTLKPFPGSQVTCKGVDKQKAGEKIREEIKCLIHSLKVYRSPLNEV